MKNILCVFGTRPEAIKMAPVIQALKKETWANVRVLSTAQHRNLLDQVVDFFEMKPDIDLNIMLPNQSLTDLTARLLVKCAEVLEKEKPDLVLVQGDTTTVMSVAMACFYKNIAIGHVEAGLRTWDIKNPFPEEMNRVITGKLATMHFAPTETSKSNLIKEGIRSEEIYITGNTVIDALMFAVTKKASLNVELRSNKRMILVTAHRRENFGSRCQEICRAILYLAEKNPDVDFLYPVHPNPNVKEIAYSLLSKQENIRLCPPLDYAEFVTAMNKSYFILSDSGGVQEEAPALGKPVLVLRDETERPEAAEVGVVKLVGANFERIVKESQTLLDDEKAYKLMAKGASPYGDGLASSRITKAIKNYFNKV
jgi:UDP-N-acetylglucosamine 2-epimerase (non-hydrolysing)